MVTAALLPVLLLLSAVLTCSTEHPLLQDTLQPEPGPEPEPEPGPGPEPDAQLVEAVEEVLKRIRSELPEKRSIPRCVVGGRCAMRLGPRVGPLCQCAAGSYCNSYLLKCI